MDAITPKYSKDRYERIVKGISPALMRIGYNIDKIPFVPISGIREITSLNALLTLIGTRVLPFLNLLTKSTSLRGQKASPCVYHFNMSTRLEVLELYLSGVLRLVC
jgi:hypothetical protein